jgi:glycerophosphoryl diester phosphodiesterase
MLDRLAGAWMQRVHDAGVAAIGWNSNRPALLDAMVRAGFDAVCTDDPRLLR